MKLIYFPHAGAIPKAEYQTFSNIRNVDEVIVYEYDRKKKYTYKIMMDEIIAKVKPLIVNEQYILFGHSMGAIFAYEAGLILQNEYCLQPNTVIISGENPPSLLDQVHFEKTQLINIKQLLRFLKQDGSILEEIMQNKEALDYFTMLIKKDLEKLVDYVPSIPCAKERLQKGAIFYGDSDETIVTSRIHEWENSMINCLGIYKFKGGHFYMKDSRCELITQIEKMIVR